jgi:hypothetical protein
MFEFRLDVGAVEKGHPVWLDVDLSHVMFSSPRLEQMSIWGKNVTAKRL